MELALPGGVYNRAKPLPDSYFSGLENLNLK